MLTLQERQQELRRERQALYGVVQEARGRPLIAYCTSMRPNASGQMASDVIPEFVKHINAISKKENEIDILIISSGGDPVVAWRIISMLRERFDKITALVPFTAYSAATLLVLGADNIIMHPFANLGPVDPQLTYIRNRNGQSEALQFGAEDLRHYFNFTKESVGITDQREIADIFKIIAKDIGSIQIGIAQRSIYLMEQLSGQLLRMHMDDVSKVESIVGALSKSFYHHGYPIARSEAKEIGLPIDTSSPEIDEALISIWKNTREYFMEASPRNPMNLLDENEIATNMSSLYASGQVAIVTKKYKYPAAFVESVDVHSSFIVGGIYSYIFSNNQIQVNDTRQISEWV